MTPPDPALVAAVLREFGNVPFRHTVACAKELDDGANYCTCTGRRDLGALATLVASWVGPLEEAAQKMYDNYHDAPFDVAGRLREAIAALPRRKEKG